MKYNLSRIERDAVDNSTEQTASRYAADVLNDDIYYYCCCGNNAMWTNSEKQKQQTNKQ
jgi:hypothetical protein